MNDKTYYLKRHKSQRNGEIKGDMVLYVPNTREMCLVLFLEKLLFIMKSLAFVILCYSLVLSAELRSESIAFPRRLAETIEIPFTGMVYRLLQ